MSALEALFAGPYGPLVIFALRIVDVSLGVLRMLLAMRGARLLVPIIACIETLVWVFAVGNAIKHLDSPWHIAGYVAGFATGNVVGLWLEGKLAFGLAAVRVITRHVDADLSEGLRALGYGCTEFPGEGKEGKVLLIYAVLMRRQVPAMLEEVRKRDPEAFVTVEEPRAMHRGWVLPMRRK